MISSISFCGREECLTKGAKELKNTVKVFSEFAPHGQHKPSVSLEAPVKSEAETAAIKAKYFSPFNSTSEVKNKADELIIEDGNFFG